MVAGRAGHHLARVVFQPERRVRQKLERHVHAEQTIPRATLRLRERGEALLGVGRVRRGARCARRTRPLPQARVHALAAERARHVRSVAREPHPSRPEPTREPPLEMGHQAPIDAVADPLIPGHPRFHEPGAGARRPESRRSLASCETLRAPRPPGSDARRRAEVTVERRARSPSSREPRSETRRSRRSRPRSDRPPPVPTAARDPQMVTVSADHVVGLPAGSSISLTGSHSLY